MIILLAAFVIIDAPTVANASLPPIYMTLVYDTLGVLGLTSDTEVAKTSLRLPKNLLKRLKLYAIESAVTGIVTEACDEYLKKKKF